MAKNKQNNILFVYSLAGISIILTTGVIVSGSHLNDVLAHAHANQLAPDSKKVSGEFHNHIEKQTLKSIVKVVGDDGARTDRRHVKRKGRRKTTTR